MQSTMQALRLRSGHARGHVSQLCSNGDNGVTGSVTASPSIIHMP